MAAVTPEAENVVSQLKSIRTQLRGVAEQAKFVEASAVHGMTRQLGVSLRGTADLQLVEIDMVLDLIADPADQG